MTRHRGTRRHEDGLWMLAVGIAAGACGAWLLARYLARPGPRLGRRELPPIQKDFTDIVDQASADSFPASDPPAYMASQAAGAPHSP